MNIQKRKTICLIIAGAALCAGLALTVVTAKNYSNTIPIVIGPYKQVIYILLGSVFACALGFFFCPLTKKTAAGILAVLFAVLWFAGKMLLDYRSPESTWLNPLDRWIPLPLIAFAAGLALWADSLFPGKTGISIHEKWQLFLALLLMFIVLQPVLSGGFNWDDAFFSVEAQSMRLTGESVFVRVWREIVEYVQIGRINPFAAFHFLVFYFIPDVRIYKLLLVVLSLVNGLLFYRFLCLWSGDHMGSIAMLTAVPLCFQFRLYHDPLNSYYGLMQVMFCELMGALIFYLHWLSEDKNRHLVFSLIFFVMGLTSYEMFFPLTALFLIPALTGEKNRFKAVRKTLPYLLAAFMIFGLSMLLRSNITEENAYTGTTFSLDLPLFLRTFACQVSAAVPLRYRTAFYDGALFGQGIPWRDLFNTSLSVFLKSICWQDILGCCILSVILLSAPMKKMKYSAYGLVFGLLLWLLPGLVISLSSKYQEEIQTGIAYIPVYFSYFGMALLLYELFALITSRWSARTVRFLLCGIGCAVLLIGLQDNRHINDLLNDVFLYPRRTAEAALQAGILGDPKEKTVISLAPYSLWEHGWMGEPFQTEFYSLNARYPVHAAAAADYVEEFREVQPVYIDPENTMVINYAGNVHGGFAKAGRLRGTGFDFENNRLADSVVSEVFFFVSGENQKGVKVNYLTRDGEWNQLPVEDGWLISKTKDGTLYKLMEQRSVIFDTISLLF